MSYHFLIIMHIFDTSLSSHYYVLLLLTASCSILKLWLFNVGGSFVTEFMLTALYVD